MRLALPLLGPALLLAGCATAPRPAPASAAPSAAAPAMPPLAGLDRVIGHDAAALEDLFGPPDQDMRGPGARRLQFASAICVLDVYLYPKQPGGPLLASYIDARLTTGEDFDRASCIAALARRPAAR